MGLGDATWADSRDLIVRCAVDLDRRQLLPTIRPLAYDADAEVRIAALNALGTWSDDASRAALEEAQRSRIERVQTAGTVALTRLTHPAGEQPPTTQP